MNALDDISEVVDARGTRHRLEQRLGWGGQGAVYAVAGGRLAVKILFDRSAAGRERLRRQLLAVRRLDLSALPVARPLEMLQPPRSAT